MIGLSLLTLLNSGISVAFSYISRDFYNALNIRDEPVFYEKIELYFFALLLAVPAAVFYRFQINFFNVIISFKGLLGKSFQFIGVKLSLLR